MRRHERFDPWDPEKARENLRKHKVSFEEAAFVLSDEWAYDFQDEEPQHRAGEDRWLTYASSPTDRNVILAIIWADRYDEQGRKTRIISARRVNKQERKRYERKRYRK